MILSTGRTDSEISFGPSTVKIVSSKILLGSSSKGFYWVTKKLALALFGALLIGAIFLLITGRIGLLRFGFVAAACLLLPGLGWARRSQLQDIGEKLALAIAISICVVTFIARAMAVTGIWSPWLGAAALLAIAAVGWLPIGVLKASPVGLKWFISLFAGPESPTAAGTSS